eukprot:27399_1
MNFERPISVAVRLKAPKSIPVKREAVRRHIQVKGSQVCTSRDGHFKGNLFSCKSFAFDRAFPEQTSQSALFLSIVKDRVLNLFEGSSFCVVAYGPSKAGKSHSLTGGVVGDSRGLIPRSIEEVLRVAEKLSTPDLLCNVCVSITQISGDTLRDGFNGDNADLKVIEDELSGTQVVGGRRFSLSNVHDLSDCLKTFESVRISDKKCHVVLTAYIEETKIGKRKPSSAKNQSRRASARRKSVITRIVSKAHFVELAASEFAIKTPNNSDHRTVNKLAKSFEALATVIAFSRQRSMYAAYRNSKLTYILKDCLTGTGTFILLTCVSTSMSGYQHSLAALKYADRICESVHTSHRAPARSLPTISEEREPGGELPNDISNFVENGPLPLSITPQAEAQGRSTEVRMHQNHTPDYSQTNDTPEPPDATRLPVSTTMAASVGLERVIDLFESLKDCRELRMNSDFRELEMMVMRLLTQRQSRSNDGKQILQVKNSEVHWLRDELNQAIAQRQASNKCVAKLEISISDLTTDLANTKCKCEQLQKQLVEEIDQRELLQSSMEEREFELSKHRELIRSLDESHAKITVLEEKFHAKDQELKDLSSTAATWKNECLRLKEETQSQNIASSDRPHSPHFATTSFAHPDRLHQRRPFTRSLSQSPILSNPAASPVSLMDVRANSMNERAYSQICSPRARSIQATEPHSSPKSFNFRRSSRISGQISRKLSPEARVSSPKARVSSPNIRGSPKVKDKIHWDDNLGFEENVNRFLESTKSSGRSSPQTSSEPLGLEETIRLRRSIDKIEDQLQHAFSENEKLRKVFQENDIESGEI